MAAAQRRQQERQLRLKFADGTVHPVDAVEAAVVLRRYVVPLPVFRSRRVFDLVKEYVEKHARYRRGDDDETEDIDDWDRRFMEQLDDTDILHDLFLASEGLQQYGLLDLCGKTMADMIKGGTVEEIKTLLGIVGLAPEQDLAAQQDHDRILRTSASSASPIGPPDRVTSSVVLQ